MKSTCHSDWKNRKGLDIEHVSKQFADLEIYSSTLHTLSFSKDTERTPVWGIVTRTVSTKNSQDREII